MESEEQSDSTMEMQNSRITLGGWRVIKATVFRFWQCPHCGQGRDSMYGAIGEPVRCYGCHGLFSEDLWIDAKRLGRAAVCGGCDAEVPIHRQTLRIDTGLHHVCSSCGNVVAVVCGNDLVQPQDVLRPEWLPTLLRRAAKVGELTFGECRSMREFAAARLLNLMARDDDDRFIYGTDHEHRVGLLLDDSGYIGYIMWTDRTAPVLRQIFVVPQRRRRGIGALLTEYWAQRFVFPRHEFFGIEGPNEKSIGLLIKLGYLRREVDGKVLEVKARSITWGFV